MKLHALTFTLLAIVTAAFTATITDVAAAPPVAPDKTLEPARVVAIQLDALQRNDSPYADAGIEQTWAFAHPANRAATGPLPRFVGMLKSGSYGALLGHRSHVVELLRQDDDAALFHVTVQSADSRALAFEWMVEKVESGSYEGCWMTTVVTPAKPLGAVI